jgi:hypothetical protein
VDVLRDFIRDLRHGARLRRRNTAFTTVVRHDAPRADRLVIAFAARPDTRMEPAVWLLYRAYVGWKERGRSYV